jgi:hypothetical protein
MKKLLFLAALLFASPAFGQQTISPGLRTAAPLTSGSVATPLTFQQVLNSNEGRRTCLIQNTSSDVLYVYLGVAASATVAGSFKLPANGFISCSDGLTVITNAIAITSATTAGATFIVSGQ